MTALLTLFMAGLAAGSLHVVYGPDHLAATAPLGVSGSRSSWRIGALWGLGHSAGVLLLAGAALVLRDRFDLAFVSPWSERLVGVALIGLGLWGLRRSLSPWLHAHVHRHGDLEHVHIHFHRPVEGDHAAVRHGHRHASFWIGSLHGVAGGSHLLGILPTLALPTTLGAASYLGGYGVGTIGGMALFTALISRAVHRRSPAVGRAFLATCSTGAVTVGMFWLLVA